MLSAHRGSDALALAIVDRQRGLTPFKALQSPQLSVLARVAPGDTAEAMANLITFTAAQFNVPRNISDVQVALLAADILARYWHWRFDEFVYLCKEAIAGRWGCNYSTIDAPTVHSWCRAYAEVRDAVVEQAAEQEHLAQKRAELATGPARAADEQVYRRHLESLSDEVLLKGITYYEAHPEEEHAALRVELALETLADRKRLEVLRSVVGRGTDAGTSAEEISEEQYRQYRAEYVAHRVKQRLEEAAMKEASPACSCERAAPGEVCPDCNDSGWLLPKAPAA